MKVIEAFRKGKSTLSFEFFPPKTKKQEAHLFEVVTQLKKFNPDFVSITYGAMGTTHEKSFYWAKEIKQKFQIEPVAHLTCVAAIKDTIVSQIEELEKIKVENILALRGDPPEGQKNFVPPANGFRFAKELTAFIKKLKPKFCLGVAGYPEGHPQSPDLAKDIQYLKEKVEAGAEYIITQLFFDNRYFFDFLERCERAGVEIPIIPGVMPIVNFEQIKKFTAVCGSSIPPQLLSKLEKYKEDAVAIEQIGIEQAVSQCQELLKTKIFGIHFFVLNQAGPISKILTQVHIGVGSQPALNSKLQI